MTRDELRYILDPADVKGPDYPSETFRVLKEKEIRQHGECRTRRLVLEAWDRMQQDGTFAALGMAATADGNMQQPIQLPLLEQLPDAAWARSVARPLGIGRKHFAIENGYLDVVAKTEGTATGIEPLIDAIEAARAFSQTRIGDLRSISENSRSVPFKKRSMAIFEANDPLVSENCTGGSTQVDGELWMPIVTERYQTSIKCCVPKGR